MHNTGVKEGGERSGEVKGSNGSWSVQRECELNIIYSICHS